MHSTNEINRIHGPWARIKFDQKFFVVTFKRVTRLLTSRTKNIWRKEKILREKREKKKKKNCHSWDIHQLWRQKHKKSLPSIFIFLFILLIFCGRSRLHPAKWKFNDEWLIRSKHFGRRDDILRISNAFGSIT